MGETSPDTACSVNFGALAYRLPSRVVTSADLEGSLDLGPGVIRRLTGVERRRYLGEGESVQSLAADACQDAIGRSRLEPSEIDGLIYYSDTPPARPRGGTRGIYYDVSAHLQHLVAESGMPLPCDCVGIAGSCVSFLLSLQMAAGLIRSGMKRRVLLVGAASNSLFLENTDKNVAMTFGDGAAARFGGQRGRAPGRALQDRREGLRGRGVSRLRLALVDRKRVAEFAPLGFRRGGKGSWRRPGSASPTSTSSSLTRPGSRSSSGAWRWRASRPRKSTSASTTRETPARRRCRWPWPGPSRKAASGTGTSWPWSPSGRAGITVPRPCATSVPRGSGPGQMGES